MILGWKRPPPCFHVTALVCVSLGLASPVTLQAATVQGRVALLDGAGKEKKTPYPAVAVWLHPLPASPDEPVAIRSSILPRHYRLVQKNKRFDPHLMIVPVGSAVDFPNRDPFFHNVFSLYDGKRFDLGLYEAGTTRKVNFDRPGICYIFCNIHPEMSAVVVVVTTPYFGISDGEGRISIAGVPSGRYQLHIWHERSLPEVLNNLVREISVSEDPCSLGTIRVTESREIVQAHKNKYGRDYDPAGPANPVYRH